VKPQLRHEIRDLALVGGGAIPGALLRWRLESLEGLVPHSLQSALGSHGLANMIGCLVIGLVLAGSAARPRLMLAVGIGFCGSLTTFCSWMLELARALESGQMSAFSGVLVVSLVGGLGLVSLGYALGQGVARRRG
jgi:CrcB protein